LPLWSLISLNVGRRKIRISEKRDLLRKLPVKQGGGVMNINGKGSVKSLYKNNGMKI